jgi:APA family basic amino acid/polyamine antiporter
LRGRSIAANKIFGEKGGKFIAVLISVGLIASINSLLILGPRVTQAIASDYSLLKKLGFENRNGSPVYATVLLTLIALTLIWSSTFEQIMTLIGFTLGIFTISSVAGIFLLRNRMRKNGEEFYHTFGYPYIPLFFVIVEGCMMVYVLANRTVESLTGFAITLAGLILWFILVRKKRGQE